MFSQVKVGGRGGVGGEGGGACGVRLQQAGPLL